ncbi:MAG: hypothetical protein FWC38_08235 [Proteobacteria bacterium]|nr:hypothetical protein [Pseudomonadota bacterium]
MSENRYQKTDVRSQKCVIARNEVTKQSRKCAQRENAGLLRFARDDVFFFALYAFFAVNFSGL